MTPVLKKNVGYQVDAEMACDDNLRRKEVTLFVLAQFARDGSAERYIRTDGRIGWRATQKLMEALSEGEMEAEENDCIL